MHTYSVTLFKAAQLQCENILGFEPIDVKQLVRPLCLKAAATKKSVFSVLPVKDLMALLIHERHI